MRSLMILVVVGLFALGCKKGDDAAAKKADEKSDCQKATDNLLSLAKADPELSKRISDEKPDELVKECDKEEKKHPGNAKCAAAAKSMEELMKCGDKGGDEKPPAEDKPPAAEPKTEEGK